MEGINQESDSESKVTKEKDSGWKKERVMEEKERKNGRRRKRGKLREKNFNFLSRDMMKI